MRRPTLALVLAFALPLAACTSTTGGTGSSTATPSSAHRTESASSPASSGSSSSPSAAPTGDAASRALAGMSLAERVGQLFMVDCPSTGVASATVAAIQADHVGAVILDNNSTLGVAGTRAVTTQLQSLAPSGVGLFIATDQEGGEVQRLQGPGFTSIPSAVQQGTLAAATLRADARTWGTQLRSAGVDVDLAPVLDTVPPGSAPNPPIGDLDREYGRTPAAVTTHAVAVLQGLAAAGVDATGKHFPGLGRVTGDTDNAAGVTDTVTTRTDPYLAPYAAAARAGVPFMMVSSAIYSRIDPGVPGLFSSTIVTGMLRDQLGFRGVIITDDVGAAKQVLSYPPGVRAVRFLRAGGTMVLTVTASVVPAMTAAVIAEARADPSFAATVNADALLVLKAKQAAGLLR